jgi:hypothetical protein
MAPQRGQRIARIPTTRLLLPRSAMSAGIEMAKPRSHATQ